jgi:hypothetical protein
MHRVSVPVEQKTQVKSCNIKEKEMINIAQAYISLLHTYRDSLAEDAIT